MMTRRVNLVRDYVKVGRKVDEKKWASAKDSGNKGEGGGEPITFFLLSDQTERKNLKAAGTVREGRT